MDGPYLTSTTQRLTKRKAPISIGAFFFCDYPFIARDDTVKPEPLKIEQIDPTLQKLLEK